MTAIIEAPTTSFTIRPGAQADLAAYVEMYNDMMRREPEKEGDSGTTLIEQEEWFSSPKTKFGNFLLAFASNPDGSEGSPVGYAAIYRGEDSDFGWLDMLVHPDHRNRGIGTALYEQSLQFAHDKQCSKLYFGISSRYNLLQEFTERRGFTLDRYSWTMRLNKDTPVVAPSYPEGITTRRMVLGQDEQLFTDIRNTTFADHFGSVTRTLEDTIHVTEESGFHPDGLIFAYDGERIVGYCWAVVWPDEVERRGEKVGWIENLGTIPEYRSRGLGRALLLDGIAWLREQGDYVELGVEGKNANALNLYTSTGFVQRDCWVDMVKLLTE